jgi:hypothetical protein
VVVVVFVLFVVVVVVVVVVVATVVFYWLFRLFLTFSATLSVAVSWLAKASAIAVPPSKKSILLRFLMTNSFSILASGM